MNSSPLDRVSLKNPVHLLALGFGSGLIRPAPGTWGSLAGTILGSALLACLGLKILWEVDNEKNTLNFDRTLLCTWLLSMSKNCR